ncbi:hypothetical protein WT06_07250 [Burkholderia anthina]|uniref:hypothetical protein n=1 Tax=Burkholderia anthina TaxID=179879 RepID=UPI000759B3AB|nr:hypothetical protein [Burkholderia anthina]KVM96710.1 hypothetical protein WT06_07250 [Burkholderia anthina]
MHSKTTREAHAGTVGALISFMYDCRFGASDLTAAIVSLALEYVYQPHPRFWRDFNVAFLVRALTLCVPDWRAAINSAGHASGGATRLLADVEEYVRVNAFDEANAEMLRSLPVHIRPTDGATAFEWLSAQLARKGMMEELELARRDGDVCGDGALDVLHCLEEAAVGRPIERTGTLVARVYRDAVMKEHAA